MILADIPPGAKYPAFAATCTELLDSIDQQVNHGVISAHILSETAHRLMTMEAAATFGWPIQGTTNRLRRHPDAIKQIGPFRQALDEVIAFGIRVVPITSDLVIKAADVSRQYGLFSNDALVIAVMQDHGLTHLASHDADFDRVPGIQRYAPA